MVFSRRNRAFVAYLNWHEEWILLRWAFNVENGNTFCRWLTSCGKPGGFFPMQEVYVFAQANGYPSCVVDFFSVIREARVFLKKGLINTLFIDLLLRHFTLQIINFNIFYLLIIDYSHFLHVSVNFDRNWYFN